MKRLGFALCLAVAGPLLAFDQTPVKPRIGIVRNEGTYRFDPDAHVQKAVRESLRDALRSRGFDAFVAEATLDQIERTDVRTADLYLAIVGESEVEDLGGIGLDTRHGEVSLGMLISQVAAEVRIYDGRSLELIATESLTETSSAVIPTSIGIGDRNLFALIALPFVERAHVRRVARAAGRKMAERVTDVVNGE